MMTYMCSIFIVWIMDYPFSHIVRSGCLELVKYLIEVQGCSAGCTEDDGETPLHYACW